MHLHTEMVDLITKMVTKWVVYRVDMLDKGMIHILGRTECDFTTHHRVTCFKTYKLFIESFISGLFHLVFSICY